MMLCGNCHIYFKVIPQTYIYIDETLFLLNSFLPRLKFNHYIARKDGLQKKHILMPYGTSYIGPKTENIVTEKAFHLSGYLLFIYGIFAE